VLIGKTIVPVAYPAKGVKIKCVFADVFVIDTEKPVAVGELYCVSNCGIPVLTTVCRYVANVLIDILRSAPFDVLKIRIKSPALTVVFSFR
jgi:hypothetical protein